MIHLDSLFGTKDTILHNVGCVALVCVDETMPLRHGASLAMVLWPVEAKVRRIAATFWLRATTLQFRWHSPKFGSPGVHVTVSIKLETRTMKDTKHVILYNISLSGPERKQLLSS
jgi:hypothetical protein